MSEWSFLVADNEGFPCDAMRHYPTGVVFFMADPSSPLHHHVVCEYPVGVSLDAMAPYFGDNEAAEGSARAEYERLLAAGEISMHCEFCRIEGRAFIRGLCPGCSLLCWICGEAAAVSEIPSNRYRAGDSYAVPPATYCLGCFAESELEREANEREAAATCITDADIPF